MSAKEKRRATTFRTSRGAIVNVTYPSIYIAPGIAPVDVTNALREELDIHSTFTWEKFLREGVDAHFNARKADLAGVESTALPSDYWVQTEFKSPFAGRVTCPASLSSVSIYSKRSYTYPYLVTRVILPDLTAFPNSSGVWIGFENGAACGAGIAAFYYTVIAGVERLFAYLHGGFWAAQYVDITSLLPVTYKTALNYYSVFVQKNLVEYYINNVLAAVMLNLPEVAFTSISSPPYAIWGSNARVSSNLDILLEAVGQGRELTVQIAPFWFRVAETGSSLLPRVYRLYDAGTNTLFAGLAIAAGSETSHPVPVFGYERKTIYFRANQNSVADGLVIEVLLQTGNWREYDAVTYAANDDWHYSIVAEAVLVRLRYTPAAYPATIADGEVVLK